ncbi:MAG: hypothetical protein SPK69_03950 [Synergistales bacterium]|nr:hypothetical protein [Synergistales bacterium]MDY6402281.1 hypothetical protein [Synergistales bacterium]MDY6405474.1 hypothetical protein [Synergistales bacterium]MDY6410757.1 hypothetical protein [Synergistales bacterium]MDY6422259.1 hypothetical protein [Synergistales bacterium]
MADKAKRKAKNKQRRSLFDRINKIAAAIFWVVRTVLMLIDWFTR